MDLVEITGDSFGVDIYLAYATADNFTGEPVYKNTVCYLHEEAASALARARDSAGRLGYGLRIYDAFRPTEAQWVLWNHTPDPDFLAHPERGSPHSRGVAVDLTLTGEDGNALDMGTGFDAFTPLSHHGNQEISDTAIANRMMLLGIMTEAGWDFYRNEWWHYQLFNARDYTLVSDEELPKRMMV